jgi:hypothetical protein
MRRYFDMANAALAGRPVVGLASVTAASCVCRRFVQDIVDVNRSGGHFEGARFDLAAILVRDVTFRTATAEVRGSMPPYREYDGDGSVLEDSPGGRVHLEYSLVRRASGWKIVRLIDLR